ncbi:OmpA family protein [Actinorugispora endophytica]|uniref:Outer membrane protein OmpA-like peptidoglycan-associated protein n=1 Tax=Actinorugispora endophytica TaxID=1605990 RepID=A0A4R6V0W5_9ACTN|nr:OmpA family protein [Actinorugispora endophytica]TDQ52126.1 outer membrane protein OmpA-like peptidoglycan-associated protein [Actinorugispora endophytica]
MSRSAEPRGRARTLLGAVLLLGTASLVPAGSAAADETAQPLSEDFSDQQVASAPILDLELPVRDLAAPVRDLTFATANEDGSVTDSVDTEERTVTLAADVLFEFDEAALGPEAEDVLAEAAGILRSDAVGATVRIDGHTDARGSEEYNQTLSEERARTVETELDALLADVDVSFETEGHGSADPVEPNELDGEDNPDGRAANRRVEISFPPPEPR